MRRRLFLLLPLAARLWADSAQQVYDLFDKIATALSASEPTGFLEGFDRAMPTFEKLARYVQAITSQSDVVSSIDVLSNEGNDQERTVELDWLLQLSGEGQTVRRRQTVKCRVRREKKKWKIVSLEPVEFFAPIRPQ